MTDVSIHDLFDRVRQHPDYVWGTVFTTGDVEDQTGIEPDDPSAIDLVNALKELDTE